MYQLKSVGCLSLLQRYPLGILIKIEMIKIGKRTGAHLPQHDCCSLILTSLWHKVASMKVTRRLLGEHKKNKGNKSWAEEAKNLRKNFYFDLLKTIVDQINWSSESLILLNTTLFTNMRILKFKSQLTIAFLTAVNHLNGPLRKQNFTLTGSKGHGLWFLIGGFRSVLGVSVFQGSLLVIVIMIDGSEKRNCEGGFWTLEFACLWKVQ